MTKLLHCGSRILSLLLFCTAISLHGALTNSWTGAAGDGLWSNPGNWSSGDLPTDSEIILVNVPSTYVVQVDMDVAVAGLFFGATGTGDPHDTNIYSAEITGSQTLRITGGHSVSSSGEMIITPSAALLLEAGTLYGSHVLVNGELDWSDGAVDNSDITVSPVGKLRFTGTQMKYLNAGTIANSGTILWEGGSLDGPGGTFWNAGMFVIETNCHFFGDGEFYNLGTILCPAGSGEQYLENFRVFHNRGSILAEAGATLTLIGGNYTFEDGSEIAGDGLVRLAGEAWGSASILLTGTLEFDNGIIFGEHSFSGPGRFDWRSGYFHGGRTTFEEGAHLNVLGSEAKFLDLHIITNLGTITWEGGGSLGGSGGIFWNAGTFIIKTNCHFGGDGEFYNTGTFLFPLGSGERYLESSWAFHNRGTILAEAGATLTLMGGIYIFEDGGEIAGDGLVRLAGDAGGSGSVLLTGTLELDNGRISGEYSFSGPGRFDWRSGYFHGGRTTFEEGAHLNVLGSEAKFLDSHIITNLGTITWDGGGSLDGSGGVFWNAGTFVIENNCHFRGDGEFYNTGTVLCPEGSGERYLESFWAFHNRGTILAEAGATLTLMGGIYIFEDGSEIAGDGLVRLAGDADGSGSVLLTGTLELDNGRISGEYSFSGPGRFDWRSGYFHGGRTTFEEGAQLRFVGSEARFLEFHVITNLGTVIWVGTGNLEGSGSTFWNAGTFIIETNCHLYGNEFYNAGTILCPTGGGERYLDNLFNRFYNRGTILAEAGATLTFLGDDYMLENGSEIAGDGLVRLAGYAGGTGRVSITGTLELDWGTISGEYIFSGPGQFHWRTGFFRNGTTTFEEGVQLRFLGSESKIIDGHAITNLGSAFWSTDTGDLHIDEGTFVNGGSFTIEGNCNLTGTGLFRNSGMILQSAGNTFASCRFEQGGVLVLERGVFAMDEPHFTKESVCRFQIRGTTPEADFGMLQPSGFFSGAGVLEVVLANEFVPGDGDLFELVTYAGPPIGGFGSLSLPSVPAGLRWHSLYGDYSFALIVSGETTGPEIVSQPKNQMAEFGSTARFSVVANGSEPLTFQWRKDGANLADGPSISGATSAVLHLLNVGTNAIGDYQVLVTNAFGTALSESARLSLFPQATTLPASGLTTSSATLNGIVRPRDATVTGFFEWGSSTNYEFTTAAQVLTTNSQISSTLTNLIIGQTYYYRLAVITPAGVVHGQNIAFTIPQFTANPSFSRGAYWHAHVFWGDFNNDERLDLFLSAEFDGGYMLPRMFLNDGNGSFNRLAVSLPYFSTGTSVAVADSDNDNDLDLFVGNYSGLEKGGILRNQGTGIWADLNSGFLLTKHGAAWGDYNNDGKMDLIRTTPGAAGTTAYRNLGNNLFTNTTLGIIGVANGALDWGDFDNDGYSDLLISGGLTSQLPLDWPRPGISRVYRNNGDGTFTDIQANLEGLDHSSAAWGDFDNDGKLDIVIAGHNTTNPITRVYRNLGNGEFVDTGADLAGIYKGSVKWGDYDNDGKLDLLLVGNTGTNRISRLYRNNGDGSFSDINTGLPGVWEGEAAWGDYDKDGRLDIVLIGVDVMTVYKNNIVATNSAPAAPTGLSAQVSSNTVIFSWNSATDDTTPAVALTYNLRVGTTPGGTDIVSPLASTNGFRRIPCFGNVGQNTSWTLVLTNVGSGPLYWSVQAIDNSFAGSPFAAEAVAVTSPAIVLENVTLDGNGFAFSISHGMGTVVVESSSNLMNWTPIATNSIPFTFTNGAPVSQEFYRTRFLP